MTPHNEPTVWAKLGAFMHPDYAACYPDFWEGQRLFWLSLSNQERSDLVAFLQELLDAPLTSEELMASWLRSGSALEPTDIREFLIDILNKYKELP